MLKMLLALYIFVASFALVALKLGSKNGAPFQLISGRPHLSLTPLAATGIILYGISFLLYTFLLSEYDLGYIIPLTTGLVYVLIFIASVVVFHEAFTIIKVTGIIVILVGVVLLNLKR